MASDKTEMRKKKDIPQSLDEYSSFYGMTLDDEQKYYRDMLWSPDVDIVFTNSVSGTGKTTIAVGVASTHQELSKAKMIQRVKSMVPIFRRLLIHICAASILKIK